METPQAPEDAYLMIWPKRPMIMPVCELTFRQAQYYPAKKMREDIGALVIHRDGRKLEISDVEKTGLQGDGWSGKLLSWVFRCHEIEVTFRDLGVVALDEFKVLLNTYLQHDQELGDPNFPFERPTEEVLSDINAASSVDEIFAPLNMPAVEDCLDSP